MHVVDACGDWCQKALVGRVARQRSGALVELVRGWMKLYREGGTCETLEVGGTCQCRCARDS